MGALWRAAAALVMVSVACLAADEKSKTFPFAKADQGKMPAGWKAAQTGKGKGSVWKVVEDKTAPSQTGFVLAQTAQSRSSVFNLCVADGPALQDVEITIAFKANAGKKDQGGGVVWRYQDSNNYYVARMNPLEDNFRVYKVVGGKRSEPLQSAEVKIPTGEWHKLSARMVGNKIQCFMDGKKYLDAADDSFAKAGKAGLWTKADAQTSFDNVRMTNLAP